MDATDNAATVGVRDRTLKKRMVDVICCLAIVALCMIVALPRYRIGIDLSDEGFLAYGAVRVMEGQVPNRDFVSLQPPLSFYTLATVFKIFGTSLLSLRTFGLFIYTLISLFVYAITRQRAGRIVSLAAAVAAAVIGMPYFDFVPFAVWHGVAAAFMAVLFIIRATVTGRRYWALAAGLATALTILSRHDQGFYLVLSVLAYCVILRFTNEGGVIGSPRKMLGFWILGTAIPLLFLCALWLVSGTLSSLFQQLVLFPVTTYVKTSSLPMPVFQSDLSVRENLLAALFYLPPIIDALAGIWLWKMFRRREFRVGHAHFTFLVVLSILFYVQVLTRSDFSHLLITLGPFFVVSAWSAAAILENIKKKQDITVPRSLLLRFTAESIFPVMVLMGILLLIELKPDLLSSPRHPLATLNLDRGGVKLDPPVAFSMEYVVKLVKTNTDPGRSILALPYVPMFYFLSERRNPTQWNYLWQGDQTAEDHRNFIEQVKKDPPAMVIIFDEKEMERYAKIIVDYVKSRYRLKENCGREVSIYVPTEGSD